jgi:hypothetical protein
MSNKRVKAVGLTDAVMDSLRDYSKLASDDLKKVVKATGKSITQDVTETAPRLTGRYAESWRNRVTSETSDTIVVTVYSPKRYMLAHLLEHGHALRRGGRTYGEVKAIPHLAPAEERGQEKLERDIATALKKG